MTFSEWSVIAELISAIGVIASLIYLAAQIRQNTKRKSSQAHQVVREEYLARIDECTRSKENSEIFNKGLNFFIEMNPIEQGCFHSLIHPVLHGFHGLWELHKAGFVDNEDMKVARKQFISLLITPGGYDWWKSFKHVPPPSITNFIEVSIRELKDEVEPATEAIPWFRQTKARDE